jgi:hypothetical protein
MVETEPERGRRGELCVTAANPAPGKEHEGDRENGRGRPGMGEHVAWAHTADECHCNEAADQRQRDPVRDCHGEKVA